MEFLTQENAYHSPNRRIPGLIRRFPGWFFYPRIISIVWNAARLSKRGTYSGAEWVNSSLNTIKALESVGVSIAIEKFSAFRDLNTPCVFVGNHMSTLETFVLPAIIRPYRPVTFIVKKELIEYPVFKHVMIHCDPVVVGRSNPREDLKMVLEGGKQRLDDGVSMVVFPQTTRSNKFDPQKFNTIGIKLAQRAGVPVVPFALRTDAWGNGKWIKDFGKIDPSRPVHIQFSDPIRIQGNGREEHETIIQIISNKLEEWGK